MEPIPDSFEPLFDKKAYGILATMMPDDSPQLTVVWVDYDGEHVLINTAKQRRKTKNVERNPTVGLLVLDPDDPFRYISMIGTVDEITEEGAVSHIDSLGKRYKGVDNWSDRYAEEMVRVILKITPDRLFTREPYGIEKDEEE